MDKEKRLYNEKVRRILRNMMMFTNIQQALNKEDANYKYNILRYTDTFVIELVV